MELTKGKNRFYQKDVDGKLLAEITYKPVDAETVEADHVFVDPSLRGGGIAEELVDRLVEEMKTEGKKIIPVCPYVIALFKRKKEKYAEIAQTS